MKSRTYPSVFLLCVLILDPIDVVGQPRLLVMKSGKVVKLSGRRVTIQDTAFVIGGGSYGAYGNYVNPETIYPTSSIQYAVYDDYAVVYGEGGSAVDTVSVWRQTEYPNVGLAVVALALGGIAVWQGVEWNDSRDTQKGLEALRLRSDSVDKDARGHSVKALVAGVGSLGFMAAAVTSKTRWRVGDAVITASLQPVRGQLLLAYHW